MIEVGEYIRTYDGIIAKIKEIEQLIKDIKELRDDDKVNKNMALSYIIMKLEG